MIHSDSERRGRGFWVLAVLAAAGLISSACSGAAPASPAPAAGLGPVQGSIRFSWWGTGVRNDKTNAVIDLFQKKYAGATVQGETVGSLAPYMQKLTVQASAQNLPCVPQMQTPYLPDYDTRGVLRPLDDLVSSGAIDVSGIPSTILSAGRGPDGKLYMIPTTTSTDAFMFNSTIATGAGLSPITSEMTWDQLQAWLLDAQPKLPAGVYAIDLQGGIDALWVGWVTAHGQPVFKEGKLGFSKQVLIDFWNWWEKLRKAGAATTASMMSQEPTDNQQAYLTLGKVMLEEKPANQFGAIQAPMKANNLGSLNLVMFPKGPSGNGAKLVNSGMSIAANCSNLAVATAFVNFWTNDEQGAKVYASDNGAVSVTKLLDAQIADTSLPADTRQALSFVSQVLANNPPVVQFASGYNAVIDSLSRNYSDVAFEKVTVEQAVDTFFSEANAALGIH